MYDTCSNMFILTLQYSNDFQKLKNSSINVTYPEANAICLRNILDSPRLTPSVYVTFEIPLQIITSKTPVLTKCKFAPRYVCRKSRTCYHY